MVEVCDLCKKENDLVNICWSCGAWACPSCWTSHRQSGMIFECGRDPKKPEHARRVSEMADRHIVGLKQHTDGAGGVSISQDNRNSQIEYWSHIKARARKFFPDNDLDFGPEDEDMNFT